jgi:hypothetical protein
MKKFVVASLRDTYASINPFKLDNKSSDFLFIKGNDLPRYIKENNDKISNDDIISILDLNINNIYWNNRELLTITDLENLTEYMKEQLIELQSLDNDPSKVQTYSLNSSNNITYNVIYIRVKDFVNYLRDNKSVIVKFPKVEIYIEYQYEPYDFYNRVTNKIDNFVSR